MILVIANHERNERTGRLTLVTSHGVDIDSGRHIALPQVHPGTLGAVFNENVGEYVLNSAQEEFGHVSR